MFIDKNRESISTRNRKSIKLENYYETYVTHPLWNSCINSSLVLHRISYGKSKNRDQSPSCHSISGTDLLLKRRVPSISSRPLFSCYECIRLEIIKYDTNIFILNGINCAEDTIISRKSHMEGALKTISKWMTNYSLDTIMYWDPCTFDRRSRKVEGCTKNSNILGFQSTCFKNINIPNNVLSSISPRLHRVTDYYSKSETSSIEDSPRVVLDAIEDSPRSILTDRTLPRSYSVYDLTALLDESSSNDKSNRKKISLVYTYSSEDNGIEEFSSDSDTCIIYDQPINLECTSDQRSRAPEGCETQCSYSDESDHPADISQFKKDNESEDSYDMYSYHSNSVEETIDSLE